MSAAPPLGKGAMAALSGPAVPMFAFDDAIGNLCSAFLR